MPYLKSTILGIGHLLRRSENSLNFCFQLKDLHKDTSAHTQMAHCIPLKKLQPSRPRAGAWTHSMVVKVTEQKGNWEIVSQRHLKRQQSWIKTTEQWKGLSAFVSFSGICCGKFDQEGQIVPNQGIIVANKCCLINTTCPWNCIWSYVWSIE